jgi:hypothetical protein
VPPEASLAADPSGAALEPVDRAVYEFAAKVATDAASMTVGRPAADN